MSFVGVSNIIPTSKVRKPSLRENLPKALQLDQVLLPSLPPPQPCTVWVLTVFPTEI